MSRPWRIAVIVSIAVWFGAILLWLTSEFPHDRDFPIGLSMRSFDGQVFVCYRESGGGRTPWPIHPERLFAAQYSPFPAPILYISRPNPSFIRIAAIAIPYWLLVCLAMILPILDLRRRDSYLWSINKTVREYREQRRGFSPVLSSNNQPSPTSTPPPPPTAHTAKSTSSSPPS
jgi:hypothetical protein